jgi:hypothetical protein
MLLFMGLLLDLVDRIPAQACPATITRSRARAQGRASQL